MGNHTVRMAKANPRDIEAAYVLAALLTDLSRDDYPCQEHEAEQFPRCFDPDNGDHLLDLYHRLKRIADMGSLYRVVGGLDTLLNDANAIVDPDKDVLELHPRFNALAITARLAEALRAILTAHAGSAAEVKAMADGLTVLDAYDNREPAHA